MSIMVRLTLRCTYYSVQTMDFLRTHITVTDQIT